MGTFARLSDFTLDTVICNRPRLARDTAPAGCQLTMGCRSPCSSSAARRKQAVLLALAAQLEAVRAVGTAPARRSPPATSARGWGAPRASARPVTRRPSSVGVVLIPLAIETCSSSPSSQVVGARYFKHLDRAQDPRDATGAGTPTSGRERPAASEHKCDDRAVREPVCGPASSKRSSPSGARRRPAASSSTRMTQSTTSSTQIG